MNVAISFVSITTKKNAKGKKRKCSAFGKDEDFRHLPSSHYATFVKMLVPFCPRETRWKTTFLPPLPLLSHLKAFWNRDDQNRAQSAPGRAFPFKKINRKRLALGWNKSKKKDQATKRDSYFDFKKTSCGSRVCWVRPLLAGWRRRRFVASFSPWRWQWRRRDSWTASMPTDAVTCSPTADSTLPSSSSLSQSFSLFVSYLIF